MNKRKNAEQIYCATGKSFSVRPHVLEEGMTHRTTQKEHSLTCTCNFMPESRVDTTGSYGLHLRGQSQKRAKRR
jgi:hypothetical protein